MSTWDPDFQPEPQQYRIPHYIRFLRRWLLMAVVIYGLLAVFLVVRLFEWPWGRPITPAITRIVCITVLRIIGLRLNVIGAPIRGHGAVVANHVSWLDIFVYNATQRITFVAKSEVADWTGIGILAKVTGTVFVERNPRMALRQRDEFAKRLSSGEKLLFFPEGTSTDGLRVLDFKPTLFAAMFCDELRRTLHVQPVTIRYRSEPDQDPAFYGYWGKMGFGESLFKVLSVDRNGAVDVIFHKVVKVAEFENRKQLAVHCERSVRSGLATSE